MTHVGDRTITDKDFKGCCSRVDACIVEDPNFPLLVAPKQKADMKKLRFKAYKDLRFQWGSLGEGNRNPHCACVIQLIRKRYPSDVYTGFREVV